MGQRILIDLYSKPAPQVLMNFKNSSHALYLRVRAYHRREVRLPFSSPTLFVCLLLLFVPLVGKFSCREEKFFARRREAARRRKV